LTGYRCGLKMRLAEWTPYNYDAFGGALGFTAASAGTVFLFGGDAVFDPASGLYFHGNGVRQRLGFRFIEMDTFAGDSQDPLSLHKYLYVNADPVNGWDPSGQSPLLCTLSASAISMGTEAMQMGSMAMAIGMVGFVVSAATYSMATIAVALDPNDSFARTVQEWSLAGMLASGFMFGAGAMAWVAGAVLIQAGMTMGALSGVCFLAGTPVLLGDGYSQQSIEEIHVGQRVATDGGVANSADGRTAAVDPNTTAVDPATWRLVTISSGDWEVQALEPVSWIEAHRIAGGTVLPLEEVVDLAEMGVPEGLLGTVQSVSACPPIESGYGRVVLATVSHLNNFVYDLTLSDGDGYADSLGVTGYHKFYTEDRGWVSASELYLGETVRTAQGDVAVTSLVRESGLYRVYNMTVEADHVYYVGDLTALVHNEDCFGANGAQFISKTMWQGELGRIDIENPAPGVRAAQIHFQFWGDKTQYLYDVTTRTFIGVSNSVNNTLLNNPEVLRAVQKALTFLGES